MHSYILYPLCFLAAFILYQIASFTTSELRYRKNARLNNCERAPPLRLDDPLGVKAILDTAKADKERRLVMWFKEMMEAANKRDSFVHNTRQSRIANLSFVITIDPENVKAVLATKFKDYWFGPVRVGSFTPLLGEGIVSRINPHITADIVSGQVLTDALVHQRFREMGALTRAAPPPIRPRTGQRSRLGRATCAEHAASAACERRRLDERDGHPEAVLSTDD